MKNRLRPLVLCILALLWLPLLAGIYNPDNIPIPKNGAHPSYISNPDNILNDTTYVKVNRMLFALEDSTGIKTLVMVIEHIEGDDPYRFSIDVGNKYGIGNKEDNRGLIVTLATLDRSYYILTGSGLEAELPDAICKRIENRVMVPLLKEGDWNGAIAETVSALYAYFTNDTESSFLQLTDETAVAEEEEDVPWWGYACSIPLAIGLFLLLLYCFDKLLQLTLAIPNLIFQWFIDKEDVEFKPWLIVRLLMKVVNHYWNLYKSYYYVNKKGEKVFYIDNRKRSFYSDFNAGKSSSGGYDSSDSYSSDDSGSYGSSGGGSFSGGGAGGRF